MSSKNIKVKVVPVIKDEFFNDELIEKLRKKAQEVTEYHHSIGSSIPLIDSNNNITYWRPDGSVSTTCE
ncbi:MAG: hypothetical protein U0V72_12415 [Cytophagales bacterium]